MDNGVIEKKATIYDISKSTGFTAATVSRALNNKGYLAEETKTVIFEAARKLNYVPNHAARTLRTKTTKQIMLSVPDLKNQFYYDMITAVQETANLHDYSLILNYTNASEKEELRMLRNVQDNFVDGLILISINITPKLIHEIKNIYHPVVLSAICANNLKEKKNYNYVGVDTEKGLYLATKHLIDQGHTQIGYVGLYLTTLPGSERYSGFCMAMKEAGLDINKDYVKTVGYTEIVGYEAGMEIVRSGRIPTAICASSDVIALGLYRAFEEEGVKIPEDVSIVGMDNTDITTRIRPKMSTVAIAPSEIGRTAAEIIFKRLKEPKQPYENIVFQPRLIVRESSINVIKTSKF